VEISGRDLRLTRRWETVPPARGVSQIGPKAVPRFDQLQRKRNAAERLLVIIAAAPDARRRAPPLATATAQITVSPSTGGEGQGFPRPWSCGSDGGLRQITHVPQPRACGKAGAIITNS
jgi:hypothetical protein